MHKVGAKVRTRGRFMHNRKCRGVVERREGDYVYVRLNLGHIAEFYDGELESY